MNLLIINAWYKKIIDETATAPIAYIFIFSRVLGNCWTQNTLQTMNLRFFPFWIEE